MPAVNRALRSLPTPMVRFAIHRLWPLQEPELRYLDRYLPTGRTAIDVGAWWGPWTAALARRCPQVHSFEPQPQLADQLRAWVPDHVTVHEAAVGARSERATLTRPDDLPGTDGLATLRPGTGESETLIVTVVSIDDCEIDDVGFIKIDVEGLELPALQGAEATIERDRPRLMIEIEQRHLDHPIDEVFDWLYRHRYQGWFLRGRPGSKPRWHPLAAFDVERDQTDHLDRPKSAHYINAFLFTPDEQSWQPSPTR